MPHGSYGDPQPSADCTNPGECGDGLRGAPGSGVLYAIGGWFHTNTPVAKPGSFARTYPNNPVDFGETCDAFGENCVDNAIIGAEPGYRSFCAIDAAGFARFEFRELEGAVDDQKLILADDFYFAGSDVVIPLPAAAWLLVSCLAALPAFATRSRRPRRSRRRAPATNRRLTLQRRRAA